MKIIENFIVDKLYGTLYLDALISHIWKSIIELWNIGGSARPAIIPLLALILIIIFIPFLPFLVISYLIYKKLK